MRAKKKEMIAISRMQRKVDQIDSEMRNIERNVNMPFMPDSTWSLLAQTDIEKVHSCVIALNAVQLHVSTERFFNARRYFPRTIFSKGRVRVDKSNIDDFNIVYKCENTHLDCWVMEFVPDGWSTLVNYKLDPEVLSRWYTPQDFAALFGGILIVFCDVDQKVFNGTGLVIQFLHFAKKRQLDTLEDLVNKVDEKGLVEWLE